MSKESFPEDRPDDGGREERSSEGEKTPLEGFTPTDLARLFEPFASSKSDASETDGDRSATSKPADPQWLSDRAAEMENLTPRKLYEKEVKLTAVYEQTTLAGAPDYFVQLKDGAGRDVKVMVDYNQAASISLAAEGKKYRRPLTHDLMAILIERMGWKLDRILIDDLYNDTFYAKLSLTKDSEVIDIDCRPSDAIALALRMRALIFVAEDVLAAVTSGDQITEEGDSLD